MANKVAHIAMALSTLEQQYIEHKEKFEKWKLDNIKQCGTETYNKYVEQFNKWEAGVREQQRQLIDERNSLVAPQDLDSTLNSLLAQIVPKDFILAVMMMTSKDPTFFPHLLSCLQNLRSYGGMAQSKAYCQTYVPVATPSASRAFVSHYAASPAHSAVATAATTSVPPRVYESVRSDLPIDVSVKRSADRMSAGASSADEPIRKAYRAPSPSRDYRNPSTLPFRDFSQTK